MTVVGFWEMIVNSHHLRIFFFLTDCFMETGIFFSLSLQYKKNDFLSIFFVNLSSEPFEWDIIFLNLIWFPLFFFPPNKLVRTLLYRSFFLSFLSSFLVFFLPLSLPLEREQFCRKENRGRRANRVKGCSLLFLSHSSSFPILSSSLLLPSRRHQFVFSLYSRIMIVKWRFFPFLSHSFFSLSFSLSRSFILCVSLGRSEKLEEGEEGEAKYGRKCETGCSQVLETAGKSQKVREKEREKKKERNTTPRSWNCGKNKRNTPCNPNDRQSIFVVEFIQIHHFLFFLVSPFFFLLSLSFSFLLSHPKSPPSPHHFTSSYFLEEKRQREE